MIAIIRKQKQLKNRESSRSNNLIDNHVDWSEGRLESGCVANG